MAKENCNIKVPFVSLKNEFLGYYVEVPPNSQIVFTDGIGKVLGHAILTYAVLKVQDVVMIKTVSTTTLGNWTCL